MEASRLKRDQIEPLFTIVGHCELCRIDHLMLCFLLIIWKSSEVEDVLSILL